MSDWKYRDDQVVISGISGKFPNSRNVTELKANLMSNTDCVTSANELWNVNVPHVPDRIGKISEINKFDHVFFGVHLKLAEAMDPMTRTMVECSYEAIADAGVNPQDLKDTNTAVFTGSSFSESEKVMFYEKVEQNGFGLTGCSRAMLANRISFSLGLTGPSINMDAACCSSGAALVEGYRLIKSGICDAVIVGGANLAIHPHLSYHLSHLGFLSPDGYTRSFDAKADGYTRSESVVAFFMQRGSQAKRVYTEVVAANMSHVPSAMINNWMYPKAEHQAKIMRETLEQAALKPTDITYVEADGCGIKFADAQEAVAIDKVYNKARNSPLLIGSIKSNIGHASPANTLNSILKVIFSMENNVIPANLHYEKPPEDVEPLAKGRLQVVTKNTPWNDQYAAVNTTSFAGGFTHIILKTFEKKKKNNGHPTDGLDRLITFSGRTAECVITILNEIQNRICDMEYVQLFHDVFEKENTKHLYRSYAVIPPVGLPLKNFDVQEVPIAKKEVWYVFSGMGSQWVGMGTALMKLPIFAAAVHKCNAALLPFGVDVIRIITENDSKMFDNIVHSFVGIATIQVNQLS